MSLFVRDGYFFFIDVYGILVLRIFKIVGSCKIMNNLKMDFID